MIIDSPQGPDSPTATLTALGVTMEVIEGPTGKVDGNDWPHIEYRVNICRDGRSIQLDENPTVTGATYCLGLSHVNWPKWIAGFPMSENERSVAWLLERNPSARLKPAYKLAHASLAAKMVKRQKVAPKLEDVMYALLSDGSAYFDAQRFEDWAGDFGYDPDSRKAEAIFRRCDAIGRALAQAFTPEELDQLRDVFQDY